MMSGAAVSVRIAFREGRSHVPTPLAEFRLPRVVFRGKRRRFSWQSP